MEIWRYQLAAKRAPNIRTGAGDIEGALVRVDGGVGCLQAWPTLGDAPLEEQLDALSRGEPTEIGRACLRCCASDGEARRAGRSLFAGLKLPPSHALVLGGTAEEIRWAAAAGIAKIKGRADWGFDEGIKLRIDFNASLEPDEFLRWAEALSDAKRQQIDFVEDPTPYAPVLWERLGEETGVRFALDRGPVDAERGYAVRVWKPAIQELPPCGELFCITHNMDHEIGRRYAAYRAGIFEGELTQCGLGEFGDLGGTGLGCDELLDSLRWEAL